MGNKRIVIVGHGGSGKDYLKQRFINKGFKPSVSCTTRPPRQGEENGKDYHFVTKEEFQTKVDENLFFEYQEFRGWGYGTTRKEFDTADIFIMTPPAIKELSKEDRDSSLVIFIDIDEKIRGKRLSDRNDADSVERRIKADREMFDGFFDFDIRITDPTF